jgi:hypothetical protein
MTNRSIHIYDGFVILDHPEQMLKVTLNHVEVVHSKTAPKKTIPIEALYGLIHLENTYVCYVARSKSILPLMNKIIFNVVKVDFVPIT